MNAFPPHKSPSSQCDLRTWPLAFRLFSHPISHDQSVSQKHRRRRKSLNPCGYTIYPRHTHFYLVCVPNFSSTQCRHFDLAAYSTEYLNMSQIHKYQIERLMSMLVLNGVQTDHQHLNKHLMPSTVS